MTRAADHFGYHLDLIDSPDSLQAALADPEQRWYAQRRLHALGASGALLAASWNPLLHPRGRDGKFIDRFGWVRWLDPDTLKWRNGWVSDIDPMSGELTVRSGQQNHYFPNAKNLYTKPKPKASIDLPNVVDGKTPENWKKTGGQGGSNPGGMFQIDGSFAAESPELGARNGLFTAVQAMTQPGTPTVYANAFPGYSDAAAQFVPNDLNVAMVPRLDGTPGRYDVLQRMGSKWYRVPESGSMTVDDLFRPELEVDPESAFGAPGSDRRQKVVADLGTLAVERSSEFDAEDVASMMQATASPLPKVGDRFYVKTMNIPERARNEALANDFYELLGIPVPDVAVGKDGKTISSKLVDGTVAFDPANPAHVKAAQEGFVADAWLANWDVIGLEFDNIQIDNEGRAWRIDAGGALAYRAMGSPKGGMFGEQVGELDSLRNPTINHQSAKVYGGITNAQLHDQALVLQSITPTQIQALADANDLPHIGPILIARRKSILDQSGITDPPPQDAGSTLYPGMSQAEIHTQLTKPVGWAKAQIQQGTTPKTVFNPVEAVQQMGTPPTVAVDNWNLAYDTLPSTTLTGPDWEFYKNYVFKKDGDLWVYDHGYADEGSGSHTFVARNVFNGTKRRKTFGGDDEVLFDYGSGDDENLVDLLGPTRDLAIAELVARGNGQTIPQLLTINKDDDPPNLYYNYSGLPSFVSLMEASDMGRLGPDQAWPILNSKDNSLWEITAIPDGVNGTAKLTRKTNGTGGQWWDNSPLIALGNDDWKSNGPWFLPSNDATAAVWKSKYDPDSPDANLDPDGESLALKQAIDVKESDADDLLALHGPDDTPGIADPELEELLWEGAAPGIKTADPELEALLAQEQAIADAMWAEAQSTQSKKVTNDVVDALGAGEPLLSTEWAASDLDQLQADLVGKPVVVLPIEAHDNPDFVAVNLGNANGLGTVSEVLTKNIYVYGQPGSGVPGGWQDVVHAKIAWPNGRFSWVIGGEGSSFKKVVIPVETTPIPQPPVFKQNGDIVINGTLVGQWWKPYGKPANIESGVGGPHYQYGGIIHADHSLTGKQMAFSASKQADTKSAASKLVVPIVPKPTKPKSSKVTKTEDEIKLLNEELLVTTEAIAATEATLAKLAEGVPTGTPLADGSYPNKGDWVFSTKDGTWAQVKQLDPKLGPKHTELVGNYIKVAIPVVQPDGKTKWKWTNRPKDTLVSGGGPDSPAPFVLSTKAVQVEGGKWIGPGIPVTVSWGHNATVLDTTVDGKVKIQFPDGSQKWVSKGSLSVPSVFSGGVPAPAIKDPPGTADEATVADLNAQLAALNDDKAKLAAVIATSVVAKPKKKKEIGTPYPGPGGKTVIQSKGLADVRESKGLKNTKDGYVPQPGMILRHNDGTQYVVWEMGDEWTSHKNSVRVIPLSSVASGGYVSWYDTKWRAVSTMVVDHDAMLTDKTGVALPIINTVVGGSDSTPTTGLLIRKTATKSWWQPTGVAGKDIKRTKQVDTFYVIDPYGDVFTLDGTKVHPNVFQPGQGYERIGYLDPDHPGGKTLTFSAQDHHAAQVGKVQYVSIHDPDQSAAIPVAKKTVAPEPLASVPAEPTPTPPTPTPAPAPAPDVTLPTPEPTPADELPVFTGKDPAGSEIPHPPTTTSSAGVPAYKAQGGTPTLDVTGPVAGAKSVVAAVAETIAVTKQNQASGERKWVGTYGLADHDVIEDMMVRSQTVRDAQGVEYVEVSFRVDRVPAQANFKTFITSSLNETGDWEHTGRNAKNLVSGDLIAVRVSGGGGVTAKGALRPDGELGAEKTPNATVVAPPVLIGKNAAGTFDVYRTQVMTANGDIGFIDLEDRNGMDTIPISTWDPAKPRTSNGNKGLNPNAKNDGWSVKSSRLEWGRATPQMDSQHIHSDGSKMAETQTFAEARGAMGSGFVLQRNHDGARIEYSTSQTKNSLDGHTVIRVRADDPEAQRKISEAMELVGVSKEKQKPPDKAALMQMAADKVLEQFNPTYTPGMKANGGIQQALDAIDKAVGAQLGRPATIDDISLRLSPDGRVQVLVSEDVSRAIVKKNGIKSYTHDFMAQGYMKMLEQFVDGEQIGFMATTERWQHGFMYVGMSSGADHHHDAADNMFLRMSKATSTSGTQTLFDPVVIHRHVDYYYRLGDSYGDRGSDQLNWLNSPKVGGSNELMIQRRLEASLIGRVALSHGERDALIAKLKKKGITHAPNGMTLEDFFVTSGTPLNFGTPVSFGDEIPLSALPDTVPTAPAVLV